MAESLSRVSSKYQTVIPKAVRNRLSLKTGDVLRFHVTDEGTVTLEKVVSGEDDPFVTFDEWNSDEDERLYRNL
jgi:antitoxin PrlF